MRKNKIYLCEYKKVVDNSQFVDYMEQAYTTKIKYGEMLHLIEWLCKRHRVSAKDFRLYNKRETDRSWGGFKIDADDKLYPYIIMKSQWTNAGTILHEFSHILRINRGQIKDNHNINFVKQFDKLLVEYYEKYKKEK